MNKRARRTEEEQLQWEQAQREQIEESIANRRAAVKIERENELVVTVARLTARNLLIESENQLAAIARLDSEILRDENAALEADLAETGLTQKVTELEAEVKWLKHKLSHALGDLTRQQVKNTEDLCKECRDRRRAVASEENRALDLDYAPGFHAPPEHEW
jgi:hypothetical protein